MQEDLDKYVDMSRVVNGTPTIVVIQDSAGIIDGWPFVLAAQRAVPPIRDVICATLSNECELRRIGARYANVHELLAEAELPRAAITLITFSRRPSSVAAKSIEELVYKLIDVEVVQSTQRVFGEPTIDWLDDDRRLAVTHWRDDSEQIAILLHTLECAINNISPVASVNGTAFVPLFAI